MADTQTASSGPEGSLPPTLINPDSTGGLLPQPSPQPSSTLVSGLPKPTPTLPRGYFDPVVASLGPKPDPTPAPTVQPPPPTAPAVAPAAPAAPAQPGAPRYVAVGDSLAAGIANARKFNQTYEVKDDPAAKANPAILAASGRTTDQTLAQINANPKQYAGADVLLSTGMSNDLMGGRPLDDAMTNVASQLDALRAAGANVALAGVGSGVPGYQQANARLAQIAKAYNIPFTGEPATTQGGRVHPHDFNAFYGQFHFGEQQQPPTPGTGKTISDATDYIQHAEGGGPYVLYGSQTYDPRTMPTKPPNENGSFYGFPDWAGGRGPDGRQTHAAGGAQWEPDTWQLAVNGFVQSGLGNQLGHTPDFRNPDDQKAVFNYWADRRYREQTGRDLVADMNAGHVDWGSLGSEWSSLKYAGGGGTAGQTVGNLPGYQEWHRSIEEQRQTLSDESADLQRRMADMEAGSPEQRALADQLLKKQIQMMGKYEEMIAHPPTQKPADVIGNFGSVATLIGIFAGRFAHRPMVASLNAAGAAMQAMNDNNYQQYQDAFKMWKQQTDMTSTLLGMEGNAYKDIIENKRLTMDEKSKELEAAAKIYQNRLLSQQLESGQYEKAWEYADKVAKAKDEHDKAQADIEKMHADAEKARAEAQSPMLGTGEDRAATLTELGVQAETDVAKSNPNATTAEKQALIAQRVKELSQDFGAVSAARQRALEAKAGTRQGPDISDDDAAVRAGQLINGDTSAMIRLSQRSRDKVYDEVRKQLMPQLEAQFQQQEGHAPDDNDRHNLLTQIGVQLASGKAEFTGFTQYMRTLAIRQASIDTAIQEAQNVIPRAIAASDKVGRSRFPLLNEAILSGKYQTGDPDVVQLVGVTTSLVNIYSRAVAPTGQATDMVRKMATDQLAAIHSPEQYRAAVQMMQLEMDAAQASPAEVRQRRVEEFQKEGAGWKGDSSTPFLQGGVGGRAGTTQTPATGATVAPAQPRTPSADAIQHLKAHPELRGDFDNWYGAGAAAKVLGQ